MSTAAIYPETANLAVTTGKRVSWSAIVAGVFLAVAAQLVLSLLGAGLGLGSIDPLNKSTPDASTLGTGAIVWWGVSSALALFIAGAVAAHLAGSMRKSDAALHGLLTWAVAALFTVYLLSSAVGALARGAAGVVGTAATVTATGAAAVAGPAAAMAKEELQAQGISLETIKGEARKLLQQTGKAELTPEAMAAKASAVAGDVAGNAAAPAPGQQEEQFESVLQRVIQAGKNTASQVDREAVVNVVMARANISRDEAEKRVDGWIDTYQAAQAKLAEQKAQAEQKAREVADATAHASSLAALGAVLVLLIGAAAAAFGGLFGRHNYLRSHQAYVA